MKRNRLNRRNSSLLTINRLLIHTIKLIAGTDLNYIEKLMLWTQVIKSISKFVWYRFHALIDFNLNEYSP